MNRLTRVLASLLLSPLILSGCIAQSSHSEAQENNEMSETAKAVASYSHCGLTAPGLVLATSPGDWQKLSNVFGSQMPAWPDESDRWMLVAALGQKRSGGYGVGFSESVMDGRELVVRVSVSSPDPDAMVTQALTTPCLVVELPSAGWDTVRVEGDEPFPMSRKHP